MSGHLGYTGEGEGQAFMTHWLGRTHSDHGFPSPGATLSSSLTLRGLPRVLERALDWEAELGLV